MIDRDEGGQAVVLLAISLPLVLALLLLVIDGGHLYVERERLHDAAQLAAEAGVSLAADSPGTTPKPTEVDAMVKDALDRNLPGDAYTFSVAIPGQSAVPEYNIQVRVSEPFHASIAALTFTVGADAAAMLGAAPSAVPSLPPPTLTPTPTPTAAPTATPAPTVSPSPVPQCQWMLWEWHDWGPDEVNSYWSAASAIAVDGRASPQQDETITAAPGTTHTVAVGVARWSQWVNQPTAWTPAHSITLPSSFFLRREFDDVIDGHPFDWHLLVVRSGCGG